MAAMMSYWRAVTPRAWPWLAPCAVAFGLTACATAPKPTAASRRLTRNAPATVEGRVSDREGRPAAGIGVRAIPRGEDIPWGPPAITACDGTFRLSVPAPAAYGFLLDWKGTGVMTPEADDPALVGVSVEPSGVVRDVTLVFDAAAWHRATDAIPADTPACP
jgi:hypothetical protein